MKCEICGYRIRSKNHEKGDHHKRAVETGKKKGETK